MTRVPPRKKKEVHFFRFTLPDALGAKTKRVLDALQKADDPTQHGAELSEVIIALMDAGLKFYFLDPMKQIRLNAVVFQGSALGLAGVIGIIAPMVRNVVAHLDDKQLREVARIMQEMMR